MEVMVSSNFKIPRKSPILSWQMPLSKCGLKGDITRFSSWLIHVKLPLCIKNSTHQIFWQWPAVGLVRIPCLITLTPPLGSTSSIGTPITRWNFWKESLVIQSEFLFKVVWTRLLHIFRLQTDLDQIWLNDFNFDQSRAQLTSSFQNWNCSTESCILTEICAILLFRLLSYLS